MGRSFYMFRSAVNDFSLVVAAVRRHNELGIAESIMCQEIVIVNNRYYLICSNNGGADDSNSYLMGLGLESHFRIWYAMEAKPNWFYARDERALSLWHAESVDSVPGTSTPDVIVMW